jgi:hypothetical protein
MRRGAGGGTNTNDAKRQADPPIGLRFGVVGVP